MRRLSVLLASAVMALTLVAAATGASAAPKQQTNHFYGALDYSQAKGSFSWAAATSKAAANRAAYNGCKKSGATDCVTIAWVYNGWVVVAQSRKFIATGWGATKREASHAAVTRCESGGAPTCKATSWFRPDIDPNKKTTGGYKLPGP